MAQWRNAYQVSDFARRVLSSSELAELVTDVPDLRVSSDPDDNKFLATADAGRADYLVTGDVGDLFRLGKYKRVTITSPREFLSVLRASSEQG